jgi:hypothetical protein
MVSDIFEAIVDGSQLEEAVSTHVAAWLPVYLREIEIQRGLTQDSLPSVRSFATFSHLDRFDESQLPGVVVFSPGLSSAPTMEGDGSYTATWNIGVAVVVSAKDQASTNMLAKVYAAAVRAIMIQKSSIGGFAVHTKWTDESYDDLGDPGDERTISAGVGMFEVAVEAVINKRGGPRTWPQAEPPDPETQPGSQWPEAQEVIVVTEKEGVS